MRFDYFSSNSASDQDQPWEAAVYQLFVAKIRVMAVQCQCSVWDYKDTISEKRTKTPIKSSDFLLHPFSFLVLPLLGFAVQMWPSTYLEIFFKAYLFTFFSSKTLEIIWVYCSCLRLVTAAAAGPGSGRSKLSSRLEKLRILTFPNPVKLTPIRGFLNSSDILSSPLKG